MNGIEHLLQFHAVLDPDLHLVLSRKLLSQRRQCGPHHLPQDMGHLLSIPWSEYVAIHDPIKEDFKAFKFIIITQNELFTC